MINPYRIGLVFLYRYTSNISLVPWNHENLYIVAILLAFLSLLNYNFPYTCIVHNRKTLVKYDKRFFWLTDLVPYFFIL